MVLFQNLRKKEVKRSGIPARAIVDGDWGDTSEEPPEPPLVLANLYIKPLGSRKREN